MRRERALDRPDRQVPDNDAHDGDDAFQRDDDEEEDLLLVACSLLPAASGSTRFATARKLIRSHS